MLLLLFKVALFFLCTLAQSPKLMGHEGDEEGFMESVFNCRDKYVNFFSTSTGILHFMFQSVRI